MRKRNKYVNDLKKQESIRIKSEFPQSSCLKANTNLPINKNTERRALTHYHASQLKMTQIFIKANMMQNHSQRVINKK
jgi:hypothetical protein